MTMRLHTLKSTPGARKERRRVGRGESSGLGKTSGRGHKGQHSRTGSGFRPTFEGGQMPLIRRIPKRGFNHPSKVVCLPVNVGSLEAFEDGSTVTVEAIRAAGLAKGGAPVKILGNGDLKKKLIVQAHLFSASARAKIEAAGGRCETPAAK